MADKPIKSAAGAPDGPKKPGDSRLEQAQKRAQAMTAGGGRRPVGAGQFFQEAWVELKKTTWPNKDVLTKSTTVVLALVAATAVYVGALDFLLTKLTSPLFNGH